MCSSFASEPEWAEKRRVRVGVGVLVEKEGKVLLGRRKGAHGASTWAPPGGHLEFGESVRECAARELLEETGLKATSSTLGPWVENAMDNGKKHYITIYVKVDQFEGELQLLEPDKCEGWQWFSWNDLPQPLFPSLASFVDRSSEEEKLLDTTFRYIDFIHRVSQGEVFPQREIAASLLDPNCKKVFNGKLYTQNREEFVSDLVSVHKTQGCWTVHPVDVMASPQNRSAILRLMIEMENGGAFTAIVILRYDPNYLITEINEVFNKLDESYNF